MKNVIAFILVLSLCSALCACGGSKYTGTYIRKSGGSGIDDAAAIETTLVLSANGTGSMVKKVKTANANDVLRYGYKAGYVFSEYELIWEENDGYLFIEASGKTYRYQGESKHKFTESYELKGKVLYTLEGESTDFVKE